MPKQKDLVGVRTRHLVVLSYAGKHKQGGATWLCRCELCGSEVVLRAQRISEGQSTCSIRCGVTESNAKRTKHGMWKSPEYNVWYGVKERCLNPNCAHWHRYGGRGITMCAEWRDDFQSFFDHIGPRPSTRHSLDRVDNDKGYEPGNVRWATKKEQARNRSDNVLYTYNGETKTLVEWAEHFGLKNSQLRTRWYKGIRGSRLFAPVRKYKDRPSNATSYDI
jgi:hypothetical protein